MKGNTKIQNFENVLGDKGTKQSNFENFRNTVQ